MVSEHVGSADHRTPPPVAHVTTISDSLLFLRGQVRYIRRRGLDVCAICSPGEWLEPFGEDEGVPTHAIEMQRKIAPLRDVGAVWRLVRLLRQLRPMIVHAHTPKGGLLAMLAALMARSPVRVYHMRGLPYTTASGWRRILLKTTERVSTRLAHRVFCVSHSLRWLAIEERLCAADKIVVFGSGSGNGVDANGQYNPTRFDFSQRRLLRAELGVNGEQPVIGFVGRLARDKGLQELAVAWAQLRAAYPDVHLVVTGPVEKRDSISPELMEMLAKDPRVHVTGPLNDTATVYAACDLVVLPTYREGFPNVLLEAAAMGLPVVATRVVGCVDAVEQGKTGLLVPPYDPVALRVALERYLERPDLRHEHGLAARQRVLREFQQETIWEGIYEEYARLLRQRGMAA